MYLVIGLGNPGGKYARTRHNAGFDVIELLADRLRAPLTKLKCKALISETKIGDERVVLAQPQTFMNLSGESVVELVNWYKADMNSLIICYDDVDLETGALRVRASGSAGTHNGMRSIIYLLGKDNFPRVRVGIGKPAPGWDLADHVLSGYQTPKERELAFSAYQDAADAIVELITKGVDSAVRLANERTALRYPKAAKPQKSKASEAAINFTEVGHHIWDRIRSNVLNGAACSINMNGKTVYQAVCGWADIENEKKMRKDTLFRLASMTKPITAVAVMMMNERGKIDLDAPVSDIILELKGMKKRGGASAREITARDLLTHSSGLAHEGEIERDALVHSIPPEEVTLANVVRLYSRLELDFEPGSQTGYSPIAAFDVLARMVEIQANLPFSEFVHLAIFEPLKMKETVWQPTDAQWTRVATPYAATEDGLRPETMARVGFGSFPRIYDAGGAGLIGTLNDYARFAEMLLNEGELDGARLLKSETVRAMRTPQLSSEVENVGTTETWGLGMRVITAPQSENQPMPVGSFGWSGAYGTHFWVDPSHRLTAVYMINMTTAGGSGAATSREFERDVYSALKKR